MLNTFYSFPYEVRMVRATEDRLQRIYEGASIGLKGDALAKVAGLTPVEYRQLTQFDPIAKHAEELGRADTEARLSRVLHDQAYSGDAKVALEILKHQHNWVATQQINVAVDQRISITQALEQAQARVIEGVCEQLEGDSESDTSDSDNDSVMFHMKPQERVA